MSVLDKISLNEVQRSAVVYDDGPQLVFAGAGTGKTRVLTAKIAWLIEQGFYPAEILAATFTNKAAREMRQRVESLTGLPASGMWIGTFHSLCGRILRRDGSHLGYKPGFTIYDVKDQTALMKKVLKNLEIDDRSLPPRQALAAVSAHKNACIPPEKLQGSARGFFEEMLVKVYATYQKALFEAQAMDFDDLLTNTVYLLERTPAVLDKYRAMFKYVLVDEYQDTNAAQYQFLKLLAADRGQVFVVGDDDQSIYGWRGARVENILSFEKEFAGTRVFMLEQNYRSTKMILDFANAAIADNTVRAQKKLWTAYDAGAQVAVTRFRDDRQEAEAVADRITELLSQKIRGEQMAILYRTNAQSRVFEEILRRRKIPYVLVGGMSFYERAEIKDCLAYLRLLVNPKDNVGFERVFNLPARGLGEKALDSLLELAAPQGKGALEALLDGEVSSLPSRCQKGFLDVKDIFSLLTALERDHASLHEIFDEMLKLSGYMDMLTDEDSEEAAGRIENINELDHAITIWGEEHPEGTLAEFLEEVSLATDVDRYEQRDDCVTLMTLHSAKGLEYKCVFLVGLEDGIIPSKQNFDDQQKIDEERRLFYVGITRAMERLECSHVDYRWRFGEVIPGYPSRFIQSIANDLYTFRDKSAYFVTPQADAPRRQEPRRQQFRRPASSPAAPKPVFPRHDEFSQESVEFRMGQIVRHKVYGQGRIVQVSGFGDDMRLSVVFNSGVRKKLMAKFANFEE